MKLTPGVFHVFLYEGYFLWFSASGSSSASYVNNNEYGLHQGNCIDRHFTGGTAF